METIEEISKRYATKAHMATGVTPNLTEVAVLLALEYGFKSCEKGNNLEKTIEDFIVLANPKKREK